MIHPPRVLLLSIAATVSLAGCPTEDPTNTPTPEPPAFPAEVTGAVQAALDNAVGVFPAWGCAVGLANEQGSWSATSGADAPGGDPLEVGASFGVASISKAYVAAMVLRLVEDTSLTLDDTLEQHAPGLHPRGQEITLEMLLNHTAGVPEFFGTGGFQAEPDRAWTADELFALVAGDPLVNEPGAAFAYSNTHYTLAARVAEASTGTPWRALLSSYVLAPLELDATRVPAMGADWGDITASWVGEAEVTLFVHPQAVGAAGNVVSTAQDVARFARARFGGGLLTEMQERQFDAAAQPGGPGGGYGLGVMTAGDEVGHNGALNGFATWMSYREDLDVGLALLCNTWGTSPLNQEYPLLMARPLWDELE
jgi:D-alanyl-D-alanine carboxypeptidase